MGRRFSTTIYDTSFSIEIVYSRYSTFKMYHEVHRQTFSIYRAYLLLILRSCHDTDPAGQLNYSSSYFMRASLRSRYRGHSVDIVYVNSLSPESWHCFMRIIFRVNQCILWDRIAYSGCITKADASLDETRVSLFSTAGAWL